MIKIGSSDVSAIKIGANSVDKVMLGGEQLYPSATGFAITSQPTAQTVEQPDPVSFTVGYIPAEATVQWQWHPIQEPFVGDDWRDIDDVPNGSNSDTYSKVSTSTAMDGENYRAIVSLAGEDDITSNAALLSVELGDVQELTGDARTFITPETAHYYFGAKPSGWNASMESLPPSGIFPTGQKMYLAMWNPGTTELSEGVASGMNIGIRQNHYWYNDVQSSIANYVNAGLKVVGYIRDYAGNHTGGDPLDYWSSGSSTTKEQLAERANAEQQAYLDDVNAGDHIHSWQYGLDDLTDDADETKLHYVIGAASGYGAKLPCGNFGIAGMYRTSAYTRYIPEHTNLISQTYIYGGAGCETEDANHSGTEYWRIRSNSRFKEWGMYKYQCDLSADSPTGAPRILPVAPGPFCYRKYVAPATMLNNSPLYMKITKHDILLGLMSGCNAYYMYHANESTSLNCGNSLAHYEASRDILFDFINRLTSHEADKALLWGKGAKPFIFDIPYVSPNTMPISESRIAGDATYSWTPSGLYHAGVPTGWNNDRDQAVEYMVSYRDVKFKESRFIFIANSNPSKEYSEIGISNMPSNEGKITSRFSGFPKSIGNGGDGTHVQLKAVDILTDTEYPINAGGYIDVETEACSAAVIKVTAADGWIYPQ